MIAAASAPGKVMLAGEYAVLHGGLAVVAAVDRRARARLLAAPPATPPSPFLRAVAEVVGGALGPAAADAAARVVVDTSALADDGRKLGLGSSAAATAAATGLAMAAAGGRAVAADRARVAELARAAHALAQGKRGAPGSGADVAAAVWGGVIGFRAGAVTPLALPPDLHLRFAWTGAPADTAALVVAVEAGRARAPAACDAALAAITTAAEALAAATAAAAAVAALADGAAAVEALAAATGAPLIPPGLAAVQRAVQPLAGAAKTTGAGGGDVIAIALPAGVDRDVAERAIIEAGLWPLPLTVDPTGVDFPDQPG